jgi:hypothetical protein
LLACVLGLVGCDRVFDLAHVAPIDAARPADSYVDPGDPDRDGVPAASDNCPTVSNTDQHDEDGDLVGDACDPCPLDPTPSTVDADNDGIGDACDPDPAQATCLVLLETFRSNQFSQAWDAYYEATSISAAVLKTGGRDMLHVTGTGRMQLLSTLATPPANRTVVVAGSYGAFVAGAQLGARVSATRDNFDTGYACALLPGDASLRATYNSGGTFAKVTVPGADVPFQVAGLRTTDGYGCRLTSKGAVMPGPSNTAPEPTGAAGLIAGNLTADVDAIVIYAPQVGATCPATILR